LKSNFWHHPKYDLHYYTAGSPDNPSVILFHGFLGSGKDWQNTVKKLSEKFYCIAPDLPGHGETNVKGTATDYTMESFARVFSLFIKSSGISKSSLLGYSMGGRFALFLAVSLPNLWQSLILESASPGLRTERERAERQKKDQKIATQIEQKNFEQFLHIWYGQPLFKTLQKSKKYTFLLKERKSNRPNELVFSLKMMGIGVQPSLWKALPAINIPILLLAGEFDRKFCNIMKEIEDHCRQAYLKIINEAGHMAHFEQPLPFNAEVFKFLKMYIRENR
jgi:2-succinyl-6-hydroxy-2,4-cyclohexadiene-1-carboxylate synthase